MRIHSLKGDDWITVKGIKGKANCVYMGVLNI